MDAGHARVHYRDAIVCAANVIAYACAIAIPTAIMVAGAITAIKAEVEDADVEEGVAVTNSV